MFCTFIFAVLLVK